MRHRLLPALGLLFLLASSLAQAQPPRIDHRPVACATAGRFPRLEATFAPADTVAAARIVFQGQTIDWYSVAMKPEGAIFAGVLPKPNKSLKSFRYYIEVTDKALGTNRTADYTSAVVDSSSECKGKAMAGTVASASVLIQGPAGVAALPAGFASTGVVAASAAGSSGAVAGAGATAGASAGGLSATTLSIIGGAAAAGAVVVAKGVGGDGADTYSGPYSGTLVVNTIRPSQGNPGCSRTDAHSGTVTVNLDASSGGAVKGDGTMADTSRLTAWSGACASNPVGELQSLGCDFTVGGGTTDVQGNGGFTNPQNNVRFTCTFAGSLSGDALTGTITLSIVEPVGQGGSATFPVALSRR